MRPVHARSYAPTSVSSEVLEAVFGAMEAAKVADQSRIEALRARLASAAGGGKNALRYSDRALLSLWEAIVGLSHGDHGVGALLALHANDASWGVVGEVLSRTPTLLEAYNQLERYSRLVHQGLSVRIDLSASYVSVQYRQAREFPDRATGALAAGELWAMGNLALVPMHWFEAMIRPVSVALRCSAPAIMTPVTELLGPNICFDLDRSALVYDRAEVEKVWRPGEPRILVYLDALAEQQLSALPPADDIRAVVAVELRSGLVGGVPTIDMVARSLGLSVRTLQRRISEAGSTFATILDDVRKSRAEQLILSQTRSLGEVAYLLGYSEQAALSRAVQRWFGVSPSMLAR